MTVRVFIVSIFLTLLLAISNTYLALKVGILTAASIPAAILSMGILKFARNSTIYEHNLIQTAASSGEAIAGGIAYTVPALIIIGFWTHFSYWQNALLAFSGGLIGVLFSSIIRRPLLQDKTLKFPEGQAISEVLKLKEKRVIGLKEILYGGLLGAVVEFGQSTQLIFSGFSQMWIQGRRLFSAGVGFTPALIGAGYIVGIRAGLSILLGVLLSYGLVLPYLSYPAVSLHPDVLLANTWAMPLRYVGVGAMLVAALLTLLKLIKPLCQKMCRTWSGKRSWIPEEERDLSKTSMLILLLLGVCLVVFLFYRAFDLVSLGFGVGFSATTLLIAVIYVLAIGFIMTTVCGYFSGLVGVSASPGSSVLIASLLLAALLVHGLFLLQGHAFTAHRFLWAEAMTILMTSVVMQIACIANDTLQDLKVGQFIGASPRQQEVLLIFGVLIASLIVPAIMEVLYQAYGIAGHMPRAGMAVSESLSAPPAAIMAMLTQAIFSGQVPWQDLEIGAIVMLLVWGVSCCLPKQRSVRSASGSRWRGESYLSLVAVGIGMYLPFSASMPLVLGALISGGVWWLSRRRADYAIQKQKRLLLACGLVTGSTLMDVLLAIPVVISHSGNGLTLQAGAWVFYGLGGVALVLLGVAFAKQR